MLQEQMILPKGIVLNTESIYAEIAKFDVIPVERILRACHVFTTTSRRLYDPTARRLENFWTRVLGGDRRFLSGKVIARMFREISEETSFVKLRGPQNRYEPPSPRPSASESQKTEAASVLLTSKTKGKATAPVTKTPHPILKKPRGPSASGPRPTARFVSPPESGIGKNEGKPGKVTGFTTAVSHNSNSKDSGSSAIKEEKRKGPIQKTKKSATFVATTASRRRPGMPRKSNSQPVGISDSTTKGDLSFGLECDGPLVLEPTTMEKPEKPEKPEKQPSGAKKGKGGSGLSSKAAGKRPVVQPQVERSTSKSRPTRNNQSDEIPRARQDQTEVERQSNEIPRARQDQTEVKRQSNEIPRARQDQTEVKRQSNEIPRARQDQTEVERQSPPNRSDGGRKVAANIEKFSKLSITPTIQGKNAQSHLHAASSQSVSRSASYIGSIHSTPRDISRAPIPPSSLMASTLAKVDTSVVGRATISGFSESFPSQEIAISGRQGGNYGRGAYEETSQSYSGSGLYQQFTPTPPSNTAPIPLARSKSQLSVLLDRNAEKKHRR